MLHNTTVRAAIVILLLQLQTDITDQTRTRYSRGRSSSKLDIYDTNTSDYDTWLAVSNVHGKEGATNLSNLCHSSLQPSLD